jgi:hypothetical protein
VEAGDARRPGGSGGPRCSLGHWGCGCKGRDRRGGGGDGTGDEDADIALVAVGAVTAAAAGAGPVPGGGIAALFEGVVAVPALPPADGEGDEAGEEGGADWTC